LEEAPEPEPPSASRPAQLLLLSARTEAALEAASANLAQHLRRHAASELADVAYTLQTGRREFKHRRALVCRGREEAVRALETTGAKGVRSSARELGRRAVCFMFPGQGAQHVAMGRGLYESEPTFRGLVDSGAELLGPQLGADLRALLFPVEGAEEKAAARLEQTYMAQPALFLVEYALAKLWEEWGVRPEAMIGHSLGEYVAACVAGVFTVEEALGLIAVRARLMHEMEPGAMLAVPLGEEELVLLLGAGLGVAVVNGETLTVVSGPVEAVGRFREKLAARGVECRPLRVSHAFHSAMMEPALEGFVEAVGRVKLRAPKIPFVSNVTGTWIKPEEATDPEYWARHLRQTVRFADGLAALRGEGNAALLEVGPGRTLRSLALHGRAASGEVVVSSMRGPRDTDEDEAVMLDALGQLWLAGARVDWDGFYAHERRRRVPLPTYPFERKYFWVGAARREPASENGAVPAAVTNVAATAVMRHERAGEEAGAGDPLEQSIAELWQELMGIERVGVEDDFFELGGHSLLGLQVVTRLRAALEMELPVAVLFENPTVGGLASAIRELLTAELEGLSDEEAQLLLESEP
jgi:acyl transferase domain-containing protein